VEFTWSEAEIAFRERVRDFLRTTLPPEWFDIARHGPGSPEQAAFSRIFCPQMADQELLTPHWPVAYGGAALPAWHSVILGEELICVGEPRGPQYMNVNWIGPAIMASGSAEQKALHLPPIAAGKVIWCQGFSEPSAGSDLAALRTRAERRGDRYVINGSKIWTSFAGVADFCFLLARTGADKNAIAIFLVDMRTPGIEVRPINGLIGAGDINEVFLTDVEVPASALLGEEGSAWSIITAALQNERVGIPRYAYSARSLEAVIGELKGQGRWGPALHERAALARARCDAARLQVYRVIDQRARGIETGALVNVARWAVVLADREVSGFTAEFLPEALADDYSHPLIRPHYQRAIVASIAAGTAEIQLDLIARRHLQLPRA
jgi:alkylation response protein AidB-like acyl-CoA dehydrogenase